MSKKVLKTIIIYLLISLLITANVCADEYNPSREELEAKIEKIAIRRGIPSVLLKSIARVETVFKHYDQYGNVNRGSAGSIGLMQIHNVYGVFDTDKLMYDIDYNIEAAAEILLNKWDMSIEQQIPSIGQMDPNVLENWFFPLWAYNSWVESNNPNTLPYYFRTWVKKYTYQDLIYKVALEEYNQPISNIDNSYLPASGLPSKELCVPSPSIINYGNIVQYDIGDIIEVDTYNTLNLRDAPNGEIIGKLNNGQKMTVINEPVLEKGYYWYELQSDDSSLSGWAARNWLVRIGDTYNGIYPFEDIPYHWSRKYVMELYNEGYVNGDSAITYSPDKIVNREQFAAFVCKVLELPEAEGFEYLDIDEISPWALEYVDKVYEKGLFDLIDDIFGPKELVPRKEAALIISRLYNNSELETTIDETTDEVESNQNNSDIEQTQEQISEENSDNENLDEENVDQTNSEEKIVSFEDVSNLTEEEINAINIVYENGIMNGKSDIAFCPDDYLTRAEVATIMLRIDYNLNN